MTPTLRFLFSSLLCTLLAFSNAEAAVYYVNGTSGNNFNTGTSWATAKKDIQNAINAAAAGDEVWVKTGTYLPTMDPNGNPTPPDPRDKMFFIKNADIKLYGGFNGTETASSARNAAANVTTLSGDLDGAGGTQDAYHVLLTVNRTGACVVDGFTISGGRADGSNSFGVTTPAKNIARTNGAGMYNNGSSPYVNACIFTANNASYEGGGIGNYSSSSPFVSACTFMANNANYGGGMNSNGSSNPTVTGCTFIANTADYGGGLNAYSGLSVSNCVFSANTASRDGGGISNYSSSASVSACVFSANTASNGGGMYNNSSSLSLNACTFRANTAASRGGGLYYTNNQGGSITNTILYGNTAHPASPVNQRNIYKDNVGPLSVSYSIIEDYNSGAPNNYTSGGGISTIDPIFVNAANPAGPDGVFRTLDDGLRITCASPARDAGTGNTPSADILGNSRVGPIDLGAYEADASCPNVLYVDSTRPDNSGNGYGWASAKKDVQAAINAAASDAEIWVKAGTYLPTEDPNGGTSQRDKTFYLTTKDVKLYGGFSGTETLLSQRNPTTNLTTLSGDLDGAGGTNDAYHVVVLLTRSQACVVDGFTIRGGRASGSGSFTVSNPGASLERNKGGGVYNLNGSLAKVTNCIITVNTANAEGGGFYNTNSSGPTVTGCVFSANSADNGGGMMSTNGSSATLTSCVFSANSAGYSGGGAYSTNSSGPTMSNCVFLSNTAQNGAGIYHDNGPIAISSSTFNTNNSYGNGGGVYLTATGGGSITNCIFSGNTSYMVASVNRRDIYKAGTASPLTVSYSLISDYSAGATNNYTSGAGIITGNPAFVNSASPAGPDGVFRTADDGLRIGCTSPARDAATGTTPTTDISGNPRVGVIDLGAYEADASCPNVLYVDGTRPDNSGNGYGWASAKKDVQAAINAVAANGEVWVKAGTYLPTEDANGGTSQRDKTFYLTTKDLKLYGGFSGNETLLSQRNAVGNVTTLSGDLDGMSGTNDAYHVLLTINRTSACVIDGFTITGGRANGGTFTVNNPPTTLSQDYGGGLYNLTSSPTVSACSFLSNTAASRGGGMCNNNSTPTVNACTFSANSAIIDGGGMFNTNSNPAVSGCIFTANTASYGGGLYNIMSSPAISTCIFTANSANDYGGAMVSYLNSSPSVSSCTFSANTATNYGGGVYFTSSSGGTITNTTLYGNTGNTGGPANRRDIYKAGTGNALTVNYSLIGDYSATATNNYTATNSIAADPLFVDAANPAGADGIFRTADDGLRLQSCSPALNAGTGTTPATDISGNSRVGAMDLGAYEYQGSPSATLAVNTVTDTRSSQGSNAITFGSCGSLIGTLIPSGAAPVSGAVTAKVFVQSSAPVTANQTPYVRRFYDITPATNANTATGTITLYFTQGDFNDYNAVRGTRPSLPTDAADAAGHKANVQVTQEHGTSATGLPNSYTGWAGTGPKKKLVTPTSVVWNGILSRWEVTFPVTGFSGFFLHSGLTVPLPVKLLAFGAQEVEGNKVRLEWQTADEEPNTRFTVERSGDGKMFSALGTVAGRGSQGNSYRLYDETPLLENNYYRLQITTPGNTAYSQTVVVRNEALQAITRLTAAPNPATDRILINGTDKSLQGLEGVVLDAQGRVQARFLLAEETVLDVRQWPVGVYLLRLPDGSSLRLIKQ